MAGYIAHVDTPCNGDQDLSETAADLYSGTSGDFTYVVLSKDTTRWVLTVYQYVPTSACYPIKVFLQVTADLNDLSGDYAIADNNGVPDPQLGEANVRPA